MRMSLLVVGALALVCAPGPAAESELGLELLPKGRAFRLTFADPREIGMAITFEGDSKVNAVIGNYISFFAIKDPQKTWEFHFGLEGGAFFTLRSAEGRFPLETVDGLFGFYFEGARGPWQAQLRYTHISAHLADGVAGTPIAYSREFAVLRGAYVPDDRLQLYAGGSVITNTSPSVPGLGVQWGGSYFLPVDSRLAPFFALDMQMRQETNNNPSVTVQAGLALNRPPQAYRSFRFFYEYYTGQDPRGQYHLREYTAHSLGIEMQI